MSQRILDMGIKAVHAGSRAEGARLIRIAIKRKGLSPQACAVAYLWLAETLDDPQAKRACYAQAVAIDPANGEAQQRLAAQAQAPPLAASLPAASAPAPTAPAPVRTTMTQPVQPLAPQPINVADYIVHVIGGANGVGTGFFVTQDGLLVTTRHVVGGLERVTVDLPVGSQLPAAVVRSYPELDLAILHVEHTLGGLLPVTTSQTVPDEQPLFIITYSGEVIPLEQRPTRRAMPDHWIPTSLTRIPDAGGSPIFDDRNYLVGMMTRNTSRASNHAFGVHIAAIRRAVNEFVQAIRAERRVYCPHCGGISRAVAAGYFYCESCGGVTPRAQAIARTHVPQADIFYDGADTLCVRCGALVELYQGRCVRCGQPQDQA